MEKQDLANLVGGNEELAGLMEALSGKMSRAREFALYLYRVTGKEIAEQSKNLPADCPIYDAEFESRAVSHLDEFDQAVEYEAAGETCEHQQVLAAKDQQNQAYFSSCVLGTDPKSAEDGMVQLYGLVDEAELALTASGIDGVSRNRIPGVSSFAEGLAQVQLKLWEVAAQADINLPLATAKVSIYNRLCHDGQKPNLQALIKKVREEKKVEPKTDYGEPDYIGG